MATFFDPFSGQLVSAPDTATSVAIGDVTDIDTSTNPPVDGQALVFNSATGTWAPGTVLDAEGDPIFATSTAASITGADKTNWNTAYGWGDHKINTGAVPADGQNLSWDAATSKWIPKSNTVAQTVDTVSTTPVANKKLGYTSNNKWEPVDIKIQEAADFKLNPGVYPSWATKTIDSNVPNNGDWFPNGSNVLRVKPIDSNGTNWTSSLTTLGTTGTFWYSTDGGVNWTSKVNTGGYNNLPSWFQFGLSPFNVNSYTGGFLIAFTNPITNPVYEPLQNNQILRYNLSETKFKPATLATVATSGAYADLSGKPSLATVATTGNYNDLLNKPTLAGRVTSVATASSGVLTFTNCGTSGALLSISSDLDAWIVLYGSATARTNDAGRAYTTDPVAGSGVLAEVYVTAGSTVLFTPVVVWANNDTTETSALYLAVRSQAGASVNATVTLKSYPYS